MSIEDASATTVPEREVIKRLAAGRYLCVDVGTFRGGSAYLMLKTSLGHVFTIDDFEGSSGGPCVQSWPKEELIKEVDKNLKEFEGRYTVLVGRSLDAVDRFKDGTVDLVFLDAAHNYADTKQDILAWMARVKKGGILAGHDYERRQKAIIEACIQEHYNEDFCEFHGCHPGVIKAVDELIPNLKTDCSVWWTEL